MRIFYYNLIIKITLNKIHEFNFKIPLIRTPSFHSKVTNWAFNNSFDVNFSFNRWQTCFPSSNRSRSSEVKRNSESIVIFPACEFVNGHLSPFLSFHWFKLTMRQQVHSILKEGEEKESGLGSSSIPSHRGEVGSVSLSFGWWRSYFISTRDKRS